jgi:hypothetical protein
MSSTDVDQLNLVGVDHVDLVVTVGQRLRRHLAALCVGQVGRQLVAYICGQHR